MSLYETCVRKEAVIDVGLEEIVDLGQHAGETRGEDDAAAEAREHGQRELSAFAAAVLV
jgi:hypothetical protein